MSLPQVNRLKLCFYPLCCCNLLTLLHGKLEFWSRGLTWDIEVLLSLMFRPHPNWEATRDATRKTRARFHSGTCCLVVVCCLQCVKDCCYNRICASYFASLLAWCPVWMGPQSTPNDVFEKLAKCPCFPTPWQRRLLKRMAVS